MRQRPPGRLEAQVPGPTGSTVFSRAHALQWV